MPMTPVTMKTPPKVRRIPWTKKGASPPNGNPRSEEHTSELQSLRHLVCRLLLEKKKKKQETSGRLVRACRTGCRAECDAALAVKNGVFCTLFALSSVLLYVLCFFFFFFNDRAPPEISPLPLPAALPICSSSSRSPVSRRARRLSPPTRSPPPS